MKTIRLSVMLVMLALVGLLSACALPGTEAGGATPELITIERQPCFGFCPVYTMSIHGNGHVEYNGMDHVEVTGEQSSTIDAAAVQSLADEMIAAGYLDWNDEYMNMDVTDMPYVITSLTLSDGTTKTIMHYHGDFSAPEALTEIEDLIDQTADVAQWVGTPE